VMEVSAFGQPPPDSSCTDRESCLEGDEVPGLRCPRASGVAASIKLKSGSQRVVVVEERHDQDHTVANRSASA
jgi:hypothetical protein